MASLRSAIEAGIASLEKYYIKSEKQPVNIIAICECTRGVWPAGETYHMPDLNPFVKGEYFASRWSPEGQEGARRILEKAVRSTTVHKLTR